MKNHLLCLAMFGLALCLAGCNSRGTSSAKPTAGAPSGAAGGSAGESKGDPVKGNVAEGEGTVGPPSEQAGTPIDGPFGRIVGTVTFVGNEIPKPTIVENGTDPTICGAAVSKRDVEISPVTRGIRFVLLWLENVKLPDGYKPPPENLILDNTGCQFEPHVAAITAGSVIETRNSDEVYHTTNLFGTKGTKENIPLVAKGSTFKTKTRLPEMINVKCDKHGWMQAFIRVDPHPFHAVTDADGKFAIAGVPVGTYKLVVWHETFFKQDLEVVVAENETATMELNYPTSDQK